MNLQDLAITYYQAVFAQLGEWRVPDCYHEHLREPKEELLKSFSNLKSALGLTGKELNPNEAIHQIGLIEMLVDYKTIPELARRNLAAATSKARRSLAEYVQESSASELSKYDKKVIVKDLLALANDPHHFHTTHGKPRKS